MIHRSAAVVGATLLVGVSGCAVTPLAPASINHVVLVSLKDAADRDELMRECAAWPRDIGIQNAWVGTPTPGERAKVDRDFSVAFVAAFGSQADYDRYQCSQWHVALLKKWMPRCANIRIFDVDAARLRH